MNKWISLWTDFLHSLLNIHWRFEYIHIFPSGQHWWWHATWHIILGIKCPASRFLVELSVFIWTWYVMYQGKLEIYCTVSEWECVPSLCWLLTCLEQIFTQNILFDYLVQLAAQDVHFSPCSSNWYFHICVHVSTSITLLNLQLVAQTFTSPKFLQCLSITVGKELITTRTDSHKIRKSNSTNWYRS